jgi:hypothetical protein
MAANLDRITMPERTAGDAHAALNELGPDCGLDALVRFALTKAAKY